MFTNRARLVSLVLLAFAVTAAAPAEDGVVKLRSAYSMAETIDRIKQDVSAKGITFFSEIDQSRLAAGVGIALRPSTLLIFGNPALGGQFITSSQVAGLDWPVRLLVFQDADGVVWTAYTDFAWIARRHHIKDRQAAFSKATDVIASITTTVQARPPR